MIKEKLWSLIFSSIEHEVPEVSYCDHSLSDVRHSSSDGRHTFKLLSLKLLVRFQNSLKKIITCRLLLAAESERGKNTSSCPKLLAWFENYLHKCFLGESLPRFKIVTTCQKNMATRRGGKLLYLQCVFSSPKVSFCDRSLSVVRRLSTNSCEHDQVFIYYAWQDYGL